MLHLLLLTLVGAGLAWGDDPSSSACAFGENCQADIDEAILLQQQNSLSKSRDQSLQLGSSRIALNVTDAEHQAWLFGKIKKWLLGRDDKIVTAAQPLSRAEMDILVTKIPCPFIAAVVKVGKILPSADRTWTAAQAKRFFGDMVDPHVSGVKQVMADLFEKYLIKNFFGAAAALGFSDDATSPLSEFTIEKLHEIHTGIRLPEVSGNPSAWSTPCDHNSEEEWRRDPDCGKAGPQPLVFDMLVKRLGEDRLNPNYKWQEGEIEKLCDEGRKVFYESGNQAYVSGGMPDGCAKLYKMGFKMFGVLTTQEWKTFLMEATFPAKFTAWKAGVPL